MNNELRSTAYHEAGHALALIYFDIKFEYVTIVPSEGKLGSVNGIINGLGEGFQKLIDISDPFTFNKDLIEKDIVVLLAGPLAQELFTGEPSHIGADGDYRSISEFLFRIFDDEETSYNYNQYTLALTRQLLLMERNKDAVQRLAENLLIKQTLLFDECLALSRLIIDDKS